MVQECSTPKVYRRAHTAKQRGQTDFRRIPPVKITAVHAHECKAKHKHGPQHRPYPVDAKQRYKHRTPHRLNENHDHKHHKGEQAGHNPMHVLPLQIKCSVDYSDAAELDSAIHYYIHIAEEYRHVPDRGNPQLYGGVAGQSGLHVSASPKMGLLKSEQKGVILQSDEKKEIQRKRDGQDGQAS